MPPPWALMWIPLSSSQWAPGSKCVYFIIEKRVMERRDAIESQGSGKTKSWFCQTPASDCYRQFPFKSIWGLNASGHRRSINGEVFLPLIGHENGLRSRVFN